MTTGNEHAGHLKEISNTVNEGSAVLFLGAGASHAAGAPVGNTLTNLIKKQFPKADQALNDLIEVCQDVMDTPPYTRGQLEGFIRSQLEAFQPSEEHRIMTTFDWPAIFTPNFDDLIELAYRTTPKRRKPCHAIFADTFQVNPGDRSKVYLFKLMGSMTATEGETGNLVLGRQDYNRALVRRRKYFEHLADFVRSGSMVFIGYGFKDRLVFDLVDDILNMYGKDRLPWSYALFDRLDLDEKTQYKFSSRKIIPVVCSFQEFFRYIESQREPISTVTPPRRVHIKIGRTTLAINQDEARHLAQYFEILTQEKLDEGTGDKDEFLRGTNKNWAAFAEGWDFQRNLYSLPAHRRSAQGKIIKGCLKDRVLHELGTSDPRDNRILLITGMAGVGKTMMLRRLAFDVYRDGLAPVVVVKPNQASFDYKLLAGFVENLDHQRDKTVDQTKHKEPMKSVVILDDAASMIRHASHLKEYLASRGRPALIVAAERKGLWDHMWAMNQFRIPKDDIYELDEALDDDEKPRMVEHLFKLGYIPNQDAVWENTIQKEFGSSLFATLYSFAHPSRKPLSEIIRNQYEGLSPLTQKAFRNICAFYQFDLGVNLELLVRSLKCGYTGFRDDVLGNDAAKVIFEEPDDSGNLFYRAHHRIIAEKTVEFFCGDREVMKDVFVEILSEALLGNLVERSICEKLVVAHIGPNAKPQLLSYDQQRQVFRAICQRQPTRVLVHHWGILEMEDDQFEEAERLLKSSLDMPRSDMVESYRGESDQTILTSLGTLYSRRSIELLDSHPDEAERLAGKAEACFADARHGEFQNAHAYHAHAFMWLSRARRTREHAVRMNALARSLDIVALAKDNLNDDSQQAIHELEVAIWSEIGDPSKVSQAIDSLRDNYATASGYYVYALSLRRRVTDEQTKEGTDLLSQALSEVDKALKHFPADEKCLRLRAHLLKQTGVELEQYYVALRKWKTATNVASARLLFELARAAFVLGYYDDSRRFFNELQTGVGLGHRMRTRTQDPITEKSGHRREFEGSVVRISSLYDGHIRCDSLRSLRYPIAFRPVASDFTPQIGDKVAFNIEFSFRNPVATSVRKL
jgi:hypothetical protein